MAEIVNEAVIKVTADASGVEAGLRPVEAAVARTGKNLENLGSTAQKTTKALEDVGRGSGFDGVGTGAGTAATQVDRATARMAESIKRATQATESLSAGAKGTAANFASLANLRGLDKEALRPFIDQLDQAQRKTDLVAQAQRRLDDSTKFLNDLKSRTEGIGKSASELAALKAAQLGVSEAAGPMIQKMRDAEQAGESWVDKIKETVSSLKNMAVAAAVATAAIAATGAALISNAINDLAELDDLTQKTGASIESLSKIQKVAAVFGPNMEDVGGALTKLAKGMATVDDESNKTHKALTALGISSKDASGKLRDPGVVLVDLAKKLQNYNDGAGKTALITDAIGKSGADLLPFLNDLAENYENVTSISGEATTSAASFQDQLGWLKLGFKELFTTVAVDALPALKDLAGTFLDVYRQQNNLADGKGKEWADELALGIAKAADFAVVLGRTLMIVWNSLKAITADLKVATTVILNANPVVGGVKALMGGSPLQDIKKAIEERNKIVIDANARLDELVNRPLGEFEKAYLERVKARTKPAAAAAAPDNGDLNYRSGNVKEDPSIEAAKKAYDTLTIAIKEKIAASKGEVEMGVAISESRKLQIALEESLAAGKLKLTKAQKDEYEGLIQILGANEGVMAMRKAEEDWLKIWKEYQDAADKSIDAAIKEAEKNEDLAATFGMTKAAIAELEVARLEEQLAQRASTGMTLYEIENLEKLIDAKKRSAAALQNLDEQEVNKKALDKMVQDAEKASEQIGQSLTDNIMRGGKSAAEYLKDLFRTLVLRPILSPIGNAAGAALTSALPTAGAAAAGSTGLVGAASAASNLYSAATGGLTIAGGLGSGFMGSIAGGLTGAGVGSGLTSSVGLSIGSGILDVVGPGISSALASGMGAIAAALPWVGGAIAVASLWKSAFGHGDTEVAGQGIRGTVSGSSLTGASYQNLHQDGGWFSSDRDWEKTTRFTDEMVKQFTQGLSALETASAGFAQSLGVQADWVKDYSTTFDLKLTGDQSKDQQVITEFFAGVADDLAKQLVPNLDALSKSGETASAALERLAGDFKGTDQVAQLLGFSAEKLFGSAGLQSAAAREQLIDLAGGLSALSQQASFFNQNFLTDAERIAPVSAALDKALASLGLSTIPKTRDEFKALVNSLVDSGAAATASGAKQIDSLLALGEAFAQVHPDTAAEAAQKAVAVLEERRGLQDQLDELTMSSTQLLFKQRDALDASNRSLFDQVQAAQKAKTVSDERKGLQDELDNLTLSSTQLLERQRAALDESNRALFDQIQAVKAQAAAIEAVKAAAATLLGGVDTAFSVLQKVASREKDLLQKRIDSETEAVNRLKSLTDTISSTLDGMNVPGSDVIGRQTAQAQIKAALASVQGGAQLSDEQIKSLGKALGAVSQDSSKQFGSKEDYLFDFLTTRNDIAQLGDLTGDQLSAEEKSLEALQDQSKALDDMLAKTQEQIDVLKGISTTGLSIEQALYGVQTAIVAAQQNSVAAAASAIAKAYQDALGRNPDSAGMDFWQNQAAAGTSIGAITGSIKNSSEAQVKNLYQDLLGRSADAGGLSFFLKSGASLSEIAAAIKNSDEYKKLHPFAVGTNLVPNDMPALVHQGERIIPAADNRALMARLASPSDNNAALLAELKAVRAELAEIRKSTASTATNTGEHKDMFDNATAGGGPLLVEIA